MRVDDKADPSSACAYQTAGILPEIRIDTSRLDVLLSSVQKRLTNLENSFAKVAESAAEAAHKVVMTSSPRNTAPPSPMRSRSPSPPSSGLITTIAMPPVRMGMPRPGREQAPSPDEATTVLSNEDQEPPGERQGSSEVRLEPLKVAQEALPKQGETTSSLATDSSKAEDLAKEQGPVVPDLTLVAEGLLVPSPKNGAAAIGAAVEASAESLKSEIQPQVDALWDAVKWVEDRMELIDADRRRELEDASRTAAENTAKVEVAKMERERMKLALDDRPVRSEFDSLNQLHEDRLRTTEAELRRLTAELSSRVQEELHAKIDHMYEDTSGWKTRLDKTTKRVEQRVRHLEQELDEEIRVELGDSDMSDKETSSSDDSAAEDRKLSVHEPSFGLASPRSARVTPRSGRGRRSILMQRVRNKRESGIHKKLDSVVTSSRNKETEISAGIASLRADFAGLLLRMEEGELQKDQFVREVDDRVCEGGQEVEISLSRMKDDLWEELASTQREIEKIAEQQKEAVTPGILNETLRESETMRDVATKAFSLEEAVSALSASHTAAGKKLDRLHETSSQGISEAERRMSSRIQTVANSQMAAHEELEKRVMKLKENKADEDSLRETRDKLTERLRTLEDVTAAGKQEVIDLLKSEVDTVLYRVLEVENLTEAVRADLSPEIATLGDSVETVHVFLKKALEDHQRILDTQDAKVAAFSGEVRDACSSVTSDVRDMLVCLAPGSMRREFERKDNPEEEATLEEVATAVREQQQRREESSRRVERANLGLTVLVKKLERSLFVLSSKEYVWESLGNKLKAHAEAFADASCRVEAASEEQDRFVLPTELQQYVAGNTQRVAKLICHKADFEILQRLSASSNIEKGAQDWDRRVQTMRGFFLEHFTADARRYLDKKYPTHGPFDARNRDIFFSKVEQGLKVAMSKYRSVDVGNTLFGKVKMDPCCIACDRPFGPAAQATPGDARAAPLEPLPPAQAIKDAMAGRPRTLVTPQESNRAPDPFMDPTKSGGSGGGRHQKNGSKFVYRGGFKIPKELTPMPSLDSLPGEFGGAACSIDFSSNGGTAERDTEASREMGGGGVGSGSKLRDRGGSRRAGGGGGGDPGFTRGLEGIISSSRMRVGSSNERGGTEGAWRRGIGSGREAVKMPRPKTAGATVGRPDPPVFSAGSSGGSVALD